jgi:hypothetical protein
MNPATPPRLGLLPLAGDGQTRIHDHHHHPQNYLIDNNDEEDN